MTKRLDGEHARSTETLAALLAAGLLVAGSVVGCGSDATVAAGTDDGETADDGEDADDGASDDDDLGGHQVDSPRDAGKGRAADAGAADAGRSGSSSRGDAGEKAGGGSTTSEGGGSGTSVYCKAQAVLDAHCTVCHDGKGTGGSPMGLAKLSELMAPNPSSPSKKVYEVAGARAHDTARPMPPRGVLKPEQLKDLDDWIAAGAPPGAEGGCSAGEGAAKPALPGGQVDGWDPSLCDEVYRISSHSPTSPSQPYSVPPGREINTFVSIDAPWGSEPVQAIAFKPYTDNAKVLHHWILNGNGAFLAGWAPGDDERPPLPKDVGIDMPSGARSMSLNLHYYNTMGTSTEVDKSGVDVCVLKKAHFRPKIATVTMRLASIGSVGVLAPAGAMNRPVVSTCRLTGSTPVHLLTAAPHAHKYAVHMKFTAKQGGKEVVMHDAPFKFGEQGTYPLAGGEVVLNPGDTITTTCVYSNPTRKNITFGESTEDEMCFNFALYYPKGALVCGL